MPYGFKCTCLSGYSHKAHSVRMGVNVITLTYLDNYTGLATRHFGTGKFAYKFITRLRDAGRLVEILSIEGDREQRRLYFIECIHFVCADSNFKDSTRDAMVRAFNDSWDKGNES